MTAHREALERQVRAEIEASIEAKRALVGVLSRVVDAAELIVETYRSGGKALFFGNGGSAADAQHLAAELTGRFSVERRPLAALALNANSSTLTAVGNDYGYEHVFARQLAAHARSGDVAVAISTSGRSRNVVAAIAQREALGVRVIALTGRDASGVAPWSDVVIAVPSDDTPRVQECHILIGHILCDAVDRAVLDGRI